MRLLGFQWPRSYEIELNGKVRAFCSGILGFSFRKAVWSAVLSQIGCGCSNSTNLYPFELFQLYPSVAFESFKPVANCIHSFLVMFDCFWVPLLQLTYQQKVALWKHPIFVWEPAARLSPSSQCGTWMVILLDLIKSMAVNLRLGFDDFIYGKMLDENPLD